MRAELLVEADRILADLPPARRESIREIVIDAVRRGELPASGRAFIARAAGSTFLADVLGEAIDERARVGLPATRTPDHAALPREPRIPGPSPARDDRAVRPPPPIGCEHRRDVGCACFEGSCS